MIEDSKKEKEQEKLIRKEERSKAREKLREEKRKLDEFYKEWNRPKDDLMCEDLKVSQPDKWPQVKIQPIVLQELPEPCPVQCSIPNELFGDFMAVLEFLAGFKDELGVKDFFPQGMGFDVLEDHLVIFCSYC
jgi:bromodomain adjacent to zinc finger domain protein 1A